MTKGIIPRGHSFSWFNNGSEDHFSDPPADCKCTYCGVRFDMITTMHWCLGAWTRNRGRLALVAALQGGE